MSDDDYDYEDDDYLEYDDVPFNEAEDLATHAVQSPVWINYDPAWETASYPSDWEYYSDEYWEPEPSAKWRCKDNRNDCTEAPNDAKYTKRRRRKGKSIALPELSAGGISLNTSIVVWKAKEEILQSHDGPILAEGQMEKVSLFKDWRERFKPSTTLKPKFKRSSSSSSQKSEMLFDDETLSETYNGNALLLPPVTLESPKGLPSRSRVTMDSEPVPPYEKHSQLSLHSYDAAYNKEAYHIQETNAVEGKSKERKGQLDQFTKNAKTVNVWTKKSKSLKNQVSIMIAQELSDSESQISGKVLHTPEKETLASSRRQKSMDTSDKRELGSGPENLITSATSRRKRKAENELSKSGTSEMLTNTKKRGRPKKQITNDVDAEQAKDSLDRAVRVPDLKEAKKRGRPRKQEHSLSSKEGIKDKIEPSARPRNGNVALRPVPNDSAHPNSGRVTLTGRKRRAQSSEDELSRPPPKRQIPSPGRETKATSESTNEPISRKSKRSKYT